MEIRKAVPQDLDRIMEIYRYAREFMKRSGNATQWIEGYPQRELIAGDIEKGVCYLCIEQGNIEGVFMLIPGEEPNYAVIYDGAWLSSAPYCTIHRLASSGRVRGVGDLCFQWCSQRCANLRADTHADNKIMQHLMEKNGFIRCGRITVANGSSRIAYQKVGSPVSATIFSPF